jgi:hypothetical protein
LWDELGKRRCKVVSSLIACVCFGKSRWLWYSYILIPLISISGTWCLSDSDCTDGLMCFADTVNCFYDADLVPSAVPMMAPVTGDSSRSPVTMAPVSYGDPSNSRKLPYDHCISLFLIYL